MTIWWIFGKPIFFSFFFFQLFKLEDLRKQRLEDLATLIQKIYRGWKCRTHFLLMRKSQIVIAAWYRRYAVSPLALLSCDNSACECLLCTYRVCHFYILNSSNNLMKWVLLRILFKDEKTKAWAHSYTATKWQRWGLNALCLQSSSSVCHTAFHRCRCNEKSASWIWSSDEKRPGPLTLWQCGRVSFSE